MGLRHLHSVSGFLYAFATWLAAMIDGGLFFVLIVTAESVWSTGSHFEGIYWLDGILTGAIVGVGIQIVHESHRRLRETAAAIRRRHSDLFSLRVQHAAIEGAHIQPVPTPSADRLVRAVYRIWWINLGIQAAAIFIVLCGLAAMGFKSTPAYGFLQSLNLYALPASPTLLDLETYAFWFFVVTGGIVAAAALISVPLTVVFERPRRNRMRAMEEEIDALRRSVSERAGLGIEQKVGKTRNLVEHQSPRL
jgi:hypothetical protein